jgi:hypothetical protein
MDKFNNNLTPQNRENFKQIFLEKKEKQIREEIENWLLKNKNNDFFDLEGFYKKNNIEWENKDFDQIVDKIIDELITLGWYCKRVFRNFSLIAGTKEEIETSHWNHEIV